MFTLPGLIALLVYILTRPFDYVPGLRGIPFLYIFFGIAVLGFLVDLGQKTVHWVRSPHLPWVIALVVWAYFTILVRAPGYFGSATVKLVIPPLLFVLVAHGTGSFRALSRLATAFLVCTLVVAAVCVHQGVQPPQCVSFAPDQKVGSDEGKPEGIACETVLDCLEVTNDPELRYRCERVGLGRVTTIFGRVRYAGVLHDPNEVALFVCLGIPIAIARFQKRRSLSTLLVLGLSIALAAATVIMSKSRGGQLVFLTVLGVYFVSRFRWKGILAAVPLALPVLLLGGRTDSSAEGSTEHRLMCAQAGLDMFWRRPVLGVGFGQFTRHYVQTAHNSYVLAPAELGLLGMTLWVLLVWISIKICLASLRRAPGVQSDDSRIWGFALLAALFGMTVGVAFLSFNYHFVLWTMLGLAGAYYANAVRENPAAAIKIGRKDMLFAGGVNLLILAFLRVYLRFKGI